MRHKQKFTILFLLLLLLVAICGCQRQESEHHAYILENDGSWSALNADGEFVIAPQPNELNLVYDCFTKEPKYIQAKDAAENKNALYDLDGALLLDYGTAEYYWVFGDLVVKTAYERQPGEARYQVMNPRTGEMLLQREECPNTFGDLVVFNNQGNFGAYESRMEFYTQDMQPVKTIDGYRFSSGNNFASSFRRDKDGAYFVVWSEETRATGLMNADFQLMLPCRYDAIWAVNENFAKVVDQEDHSLVVDITSGETVLTAGEDSAIEYYDGNIAVLLHYAVPLDDNRYELLYLKEPERNRTYQDCVIVYESEQTSSAMAFLCREEDGSELVLNGKGDLSNKEPVAPK